MLPVLKPTDTRKPMVPSIEVFRGLELDPETSIDSF